MSCQLSGMMLRVLWFLVSAHKGSSWSLHTALGSAHLRMQSYSQGVPPQPHNGSPTAADQCLFLKRAVPKSQKKSLELLIWSWTCWIANCPTGTSSGYLLIRPDRCGLGRWAVGILQAAEKSPGSWVCGNRIAVFQCTHSDQSPTAQPLAVAFHIPALSYSMLSPSSGR